MTTQPIEPGAKRAGTSHLPVVGAIRAFNQNLLTTALAAELVGVTPSTIANWVSRGRLEPCATMAVARAGRRPPLFTQDAVRAAAANRSMRGRRAGLARNEAVEPPRVIGTRTPTAGKPYQWRDPKRWKPQNPR